MNGLYYKKILIVADIEGSSGCRSYRASSFKTEEWAAACMEMSRDIDVVVKALFNAGAEKVLVKDFHRTAYNILPERVDKRAKILSGYRDGDIPGIGTVRNIDAVIFLGLHAASGTEGFLPHTLTSRISRLELNEKPLPEIVLFSSSLAQNQIVPVFFSGCPEACKQAEAAVPGIMTYSIDKSIPQKDFDSINWRKGLAENAVLSITEKKEVYKAPKGPLHAVLTMRDGDEAAMKTANTWNYCHSGSQIYIDAETMDELYFKLIKLCYFNPLTLALLPISLLLFNFWGYLGLLWLRNKIKRIPIS